MVGSGHLKRCVRVLQISTLFSFYYPASRYLLSFLISLGVLKQRHKNLLALASHRNNLSETTTQTPTHLSVIRPYACIDLV